MQERASERGRIADLLVAPYVELLQGIVPGRALGHLQGFLAHCSYPLHTSILEGIDTKIR